MLRLTFSIALVASFALAGPAVAEDATMPTDSAAASATDAPKRVSRYRGLRPEELEIWNDPKFRRQFTQSYLAETEIEPRVNADERDTMEKVLKFVGENRMDKAVALLDRNRGETASAVFDFTLGNIHFQQDQLLEAAVAYEICVEKFPKFRRAWRNLGLIRVRQSEFEKAEQALTTVVELGGGDSITYGLLGFVASNRGNELSAETAYRMAILLDPKTIDWKMGLARSFFRQQRFADAVALCDLLLKDNPDSADLWLLQANAYIGLGKPLRAAENYELVDGLGKSTPASLNTLGDIYINEELYDLAVDCYGRAMELAPEGRPERALRAAKVVAARGGLDETRQLVDRIEAVYGDRLSTDDQKDLLKLRARLAVADGAGDEEVAVLQRIVEIDPLDGEAFILLGQHSSRNEDPEKAIFYYERAAGIEGFEAVAKVRHAQLLVGQGRYDAALPLLRRAQQLEPRENVQRYLEQLERIQKQGR